MPFSVKATLIAFQGDAERYPCHAMHNIGDVVTFDGVELKGRACADVMPQLVNAMYTVYMTGPRFVTPGYYNLFWYSSNSVLDPSKKSYDGNGFASVLKAYDEPKYHVSCLQDPNAFQWPPSKGRKVMKDVCVMCPDSRTAAVFKVEAYDLAGGGHALPYTRRQITIMDRVVKAGGTWPIAKIRELYTEFEINEIYPPLVDEVIEPSLEELELLGFATVSDGKLTVTEKGAARVARYKSETTPDVVEALKL